MFFKGNFILKIHFVFIVAIVFLGLQKSGNGKNHENLGYRINFLRSCPKTPNCVSSLSRDPKKYIDPISFSGKLKSTKEKLKKAIYKAGIANFVTQKELYWHIEFTSNWWRFVDDVEILIDEFQSHIHIRSASRTGYWDLGMNRKRVEKIRYQFNKILNK